MIPSHEPGVFTDARLKRLKKEVDGLTKHDAFGLGAEATQALLARLDAAEAYAKSMHGSHCSASLTDNNREACTRWHKLAGK